VLDGYFSPRIERTFLETERWLARSTDALVAVSPEIRDGLLDLRIGRPSQYHVIPLGLDLDGFLSAGGPTGALRAELGLAGEPLVGVVGRLVPIKDHRTLFTAMEMLPGAHLAVIGDGELRPELEKDVVDRGLAGRVHFTGWRTDLPQAVSDLDVVVLTSRNEGTPVALIEALAARRAVVATAVGGVGAVVQDEKTGLLAPAGDAAQIAARISRLLESADLRRRLSAAGHDHVVQRFGARRLIEDIRGLYSDLLAAPGS
jgi:glycosyltransferase involved in cell wall biosynthesis